jgi:hypothetical protein
MGETGEDDVLEAVQLCPHRRIDPRVGMAEQIHPPGADGIEVALAREVGQPDTAPTLDRDHRQQRVVVLHLGTGVPHMREVTLPPGAIAGGVRLVATRRRARE